MPKIRNKWQQAFTYRDISKVEKLLKIQVKVVNAVNCCEIDYTGTENIYKVYLLKKKWSFSLCFFYVNVQKSCILLRVMRYGVQQQKEAHLQKRTEAKE